MSRPLALLRLKRVWIPVVLLAIYGGFGFWVLPGILRGQIVKAIRANLHRESRLDRVRVNPFALSVALEGFELRDPDGTPFIAFDRLFVGFQVSSLVRWAFTFREFSLTNPRLHVRLMPNGQLNFADLITKEPPKEKPTKPPRLIVGRFAVVRGSLRFTNYLAPDPEVVPLEPLDLELRNFTTIPDHEGRYRIAATGPGGGRWQWSGSMITDPPHMAGTFEIANSQMRRLWQIARNRVGIEITDGQVGCRLNYQVDVKGDSVVARLHDTSIRITNLGLRQKGVDPELLRMDSLLVSGIEVRYPEQSAAIGRLLVAGVRAQVWMNPDTTLNWAFVTRGTPASAQPMPAGSASSGAAPDSAAQRSLAQPAPLWTVAVSELAIRNLGVALEDRTISPPFKLAIAPANLTLRNLSTAPGARFDLESDATIAEQCMLKCAGAGTATPPSADLKMSLADLPLAIFQPYLDHFAKLRLVGGTFNVSGDVAIRDQKPMPEVRFKGRVQSNRFLTRDRRDNERFMAWKAFQIEGIRYTTDSLSVASVRLVDPYAKVIIRRDRTTNVQEVLGVVPAPSDSAQADSASAGEAGEERPSAPVASNPPAKGRHDTRATSATGGAAMIPIRIGKVEVVNGSSDFADLSLILPFAARIDSLRGSVSGLSSDSASTAAVELVGSALPSGTAHVSGGLNLLAREPRMDMTLAFRGFSMPGLTPYTGQFLGREVEQGKMSLDLRYLLDGRHLKGDNKILLDHFELGKKVESPEATKLPVGLAIAILKDDEGKINLEVPIEGDLGDPKFRIGKVILDFILRLLRSVATSPFKLLGALFGGDPDQMSHVDFPAGSADLASDQQASLVQLAGALSKRPTLRLEVRGCSDAVQDAAAIRKSRFSTLASEKMASNPKRYGGLGLSTRLLEDMYVERFQKNGLRALEERYRVAAGSLDAEDPLYKAGSREMVVDERALNTAIQDTLTASLKVDEAELLSLANSRGNAVRQQLVEKGVDEARVVVLEPQPGKVEGGKIRVELALAH